MLPVKSRNVVILVLLILLTATRGVIYAAVIPPWQSPEEPWHFEVVRLNYEHGRIISADDRSPVEYSQILASMRAFHFWRLVPWADPNPQGGEFHQPPLYYRLASATLALAPQGALIEQLFLARLASVVLGVLVVVLAYLTMGFLFPDDIFLRIGVPAFISFLPTHTFSASTVNNDSLAEMVVTLTVLILALMLKKGPSLSGLVGLVLSLVLGYFSKRTFIFAIPLALIGVAVSFWLHWSKGGRLRLFIASSLIAAPVIGLLLWARGLPGQWAYRLFARFDYAGGVPDLGEMLRILERVYPRYAQGLFESFWGIFGWGTVKLPPLWFGLLALTSFAAAAGLIRLMLKHPRPFASWQYAILIVYLLAVCLSVSLAVIATLDLETSRWPARFKGALPQARYIFPAIVPIATLFTLGVRAWIPAGRDRAALLGYVLALFGLDAVSMLGYVVPFFYGRLP